MAVVAPTDDAMPVFFTVEGILKDAPHPNAAKLFVSWYLSKDWQGKTGIYSSRNDVSPPSGLKALSTYRLANRYAQFIANEKELARLRKQFEEYTGPIPQSAESRVALKFRLVI